MPRKKTNPEQSITEHDINNETLDTHEILRQSMKVPMSKAVARNKPKRLFTEYKCNVCGKATTDKRAHKLHIEIHSDVNAYQCTQCPNNYKTKKYLLRHVKRVHTDSKKLTCDDCGKKFMFKTQLRTHQMTHTGEKPLNCEVCGKAFRVHYSLKTHMLIHSDEKPFACSFCSYSCRDSSTLRKHQHRHMDMDKMYQCRNCHKLFKSKARLKLHIAEKHLGLDVNVFRCDLCGKGYKVKSVLAKHIQVMHDSKRPPPPSEPPDDDDDDDEFKPKKKKHVRKLRIACPICNQIFDRRPRYNQHLTRHQVTRSVQCQLCQLCFLDDSYLSIHMRRAHTRAGAPTFECAECGHVCVSRRDMRLHLRIKHGDEETSCRICGRAFRKESHLARHYNTRHAGVPVPEREIFDPPVTIKQEPLETEEAFAELDLFEIDKQEIEQKSEDEESALAAAALRDSVARNLAALGRVPDRLFDRHFIHVVNKREDVAPKKFVKKIDKSADNVVSQDQSQRLSERADPKIPIERTKKPNKDKTTQKNKSSAKKMKRKSRLHNDGVSESGIEKSGRKRIKLKIDLEQCYVCLKVFKSKQELLKHCQEHFDVCNERTLKKCPLCDFVTKGNLRRHIHLMHQLDVPMFHKLCDKQDSATGSRYIFNLKSDVIKEIEVIPSIKRLNDLARVQLDKQKRELKDRTVTKTKLVKKNNEWIVEKEAVNISGALPQFSDEEYIQAGVCATDTYVEKLKKLYKHSKRQNKAMMFPCDSCQKICQTVSGLVLHRRRHDPDAKPFKPKIWKHKLSETELENLRKRKTNPKYVDTHKPRPIVNRHRCDPKLQDFYLKNIRGGDIEFWQFLKIFNKIAKDDVNDFNELENKDEFAMHRVLKPKEVDVTAKVPVKVDKDVRKRKFKSSEKYVRVVRLSREEYLRRKVVIEKLREKIIMEKEANDS